MTDTRTHAPYISDEQSKGEYALEALRITAPAPTAIEALRELVALVRGECPSLLNEDSGGDAALSMRIDDALAAPRAEPQTALSMSLAAPAAVLRLADRLEEGARDQGSCVVEEAAQMLRHLAAAAPQSAPTTERRSKGAPMTDALTQAREALQTGLGAAQEVAARYHQEMKGYRQERHDAVDADVAEIEAAIAAIDAQQAAEWDFSLWLSELMRLADIYQEASSAARHRYRAALRDHAQNVGVHWRARAFLAAQASPAQQAWQPIETAPKDGTAVDLWMIDETGREWREADAYYMTNAAIDDYQIGLGNRDGWWAPNHDYDGRDGWCDRTFTTPTHWMPLPAPPQPAQQPGR